MSLLPIIDAIENNQENRLKLLLDLSNDPNGDQKLNRRNWEKCNPLVCAFKFNRWELAIILLDAKADPNLLLIYMARNHTNNTNPYKWYDLLFNYGADSNYIGPRFWSRPLHYFAKYNDVEFFNFFIERGADAEATDWRHDTPLANALSSRSTEVACYLIDKGCSLYAENNNKETPLYQAVSYNAYDALSYALTKQIDINHLDTKGRTAIFGLAEKFACDSISMAVLLTDHGARFDFTDNNGTNRLAILLVRNNKPDVLKYLLSKGLLIRDHDTISNVLLLHYAIIQKHETVAEVLIDHNVQINASDKDGNTPLNLCIENSLTQIAIKLIHAGVLLNTNFNQKKNALQSAFSECNYVIFSMIFSHPCNTYIPDINELKTWMNHFIDYDLGDILKAILEKFPSHKYHLDPDLLFVLINSGFKRHSVLRVLVETGININIVDEHGRTPLACAVYRKSIRICQLLIEYGADINHRNNYGITPLIEAAKWDFPDIVKLLLESGAKTHFADWEAKTALDHARKNENDELVTLIQQYSKS